MTVDVVEVATGATVVELASTTTDIVETANTPIEIVEVAGIQGPPGASSDAFNTDLTLLYQIAKL